MIYINYFDLFKNLLLFVSIKYFDLFVNILPTFEKKKTIRIERFYHKITN